MTKKTYITKAFPKALLQRLLWDETDELETVENTMYDTSRWSIHYELIFREVATGKCYQTTYSQGATECQDERPFEYEGDLIECQEVRPVEVVKIEYQAVTVEVDA